MVSQQLCVVLYMTEQAKGYPDHLQKGEYVYPLYIWITYLIS